MRSEERASLSSSEVQKKFSSERRRYVIVLVKDLMNTYECTERITYIDFCMKIGCLRLFIIGLGYNFLFGTA